LRQQGHFPPCQFQNVENATFILFSVLLNIAEGDFVNDIKADVALLYPSGRAILFFFALLEP